MEIGDKVRINDPISGILYGYILEKRVPRCKCKGMGEWVIMLENETTKRIKIGDPKLSPHNMKPNKVSLGFNFK